MSSFDLLITLKLLHYPCCLSSIRDSHYSIVLCRMCRVSLVSQGTSWLVRGYGALISIWICSSRQGSFSSCQHSPAHRFQSLKWSIILFYLFAASLPAAIVECDPVMVVFSLWLQCNLHSVLKLCQFGICSLFADGMLVFVLFLVCWNGYKANKRCFFPCWRLSLI